jgi:PAS domain S-box-containing protein
MATINGLPSWQRSVFSPGVGAILGHGLPISGAVLALAGIYFCAAKMGLSLAYVHASSSAVWPPSGIALAALLLWGIRLWPGIFLGAFLINLTLPGSVGSTFGIALGNTLEAVIGAWLIKRFANGAQAFERARNIFRFVLLAAIASTSVSATLGASSLSLMGFAQWERYPAIWLTWWLGDMAGVLLLTPLLVIWLSQPRPEMKLGRLAEAAGLLLALMAVGYILFVAESHSRLEYMALLPLLWAAFRFGQHGAVTGAFLTAVIALAGTVQGLGPFASNDPNASLLYLQGFMGTIAMAALMLAAAITEAMRAERRLQVQDATSRILAESADLKVAGAKIIQVLCERAGWSIGALWKLDPSLNELACVEVWHLPSFSAPQFEQVTRTRKFARGVGLPGRVWSSGSPAWIADATKDGNFPRAPLAEKEGLYAGFGFPVKLGSEILGVIECFSREVRVPDDQFLEIVGDIGAQLGQFVERKRAEESLLLSEKELSDFFDTATFGLHWLRPDGTILRVNRAQLEMLGYSEEEYLGRNITEFYVNAETLRDILTRSARGQVLEDYHARMRCKDGLIRDVLINSSLYFKNGELVHIRCFTRDVTELQRAEEARAMLAAIVESSDDAIVSKNLDGIVTSWNTGAQRLFGYRADEMIGQSILRIIPEERQHEEKDILARLRRGESVEHYETVRATRDGRRVDISLTVSPIRDAAGKIIGASKIARDIGSWKKAEELLVQAKDDLLKANEELERRVRERTADLEQANRALLRNLEEQKLLEDQLRQAQKMESIGTLAGGIAHDFNNVLNIIRGYATLASRQSSADPRITESMTIIIEEVDRGAAVVRQLLTLARKTEPLLTRADANRMITTVSELVKQTFPKVIDVRLALNRSLPAVLADPNQIGQALLNISVNAHDAMPMGGVLGFATEVIDGSRLRQRHPGAKTHPYVCISISDTGTGMEESVRQRIFEPFFTTKKLGQGTGLGLAMVYGLVKNHNGFIDVESEPGNGTTFRIYLPAPRAEHAPSIDDTTRDGAVAQEPAHHRGTVLVVEDEPAMVRLLKNLLHQAGYDVLAAMDGEQAVDLFGRHKEEVDIALVDLNLPKTKGSDVIRALKEQNPKVRIIVASGYLEPEVRSQLSRAGVTEYIHKPYAIDEVLKKLQSGFAA